jgi:predicted nucleotidyltransferase
MRKSPIVDALFPAVRQEVLAATLMHPDKWWYLSDLAVELGRSPSSLQRELAQLTRAGILETRYEANRTYYRPHPDCPALPELKRLMVKTVGVADVMRYATLLCASRIDWAFIYGSLSRGEETSDSDVDLCVIGEVKLSDLARPLKNAEKKLGRTVNPTVFPRREFETKLRAGHHFVRSIAVGAKLFLIGRPREFAEAFAIEAAASSQDKPQRAGRAAGRRRSRS